MYKTPEASKKLLKAIPNLEPATPPENHAYPVNWKALPKAAERMVQQNKAFYLKVIKG